MTDPTIHAEPALGSSPEPAPSAAASRRAGIIWAAVVIGILGLSMIIHATMVVAALRNPPLPVPAAETAR